MNDLIMMILGISLFLILQFGVIGIIHFWNIYRYGLGISKGEEDLREKTNSEVLSRVISFKPNVGKVRERRDKKDNFGQGFSRRIWK